jgi:hypothetical protein
VLSGETPAMEYIRNGSQQIRKEHLRTTVDREMYQKAKFV